MPVTIDDVRKLLTADENAALDLVVEWRPSVNFYTATDCCDWLYDAFDWASSPQKNIYWSDILKRFTKINGHEQLAEQQLAKTQRKLDILIMTAKLVVDRFDGGESELITNLREVIIAAEKK